jgi:aminopeptidase N
MASLTRDEAAARAAALHVDAYDVDLDLGCGDRVFRSTSTIRFTSTESGAPTFFDVKPDKLNSVTLDGWPLETAALEDGRFPLAHLNDGVHELVVVADMAYTNTGQGMHRFVDPADGETYVYAAMFLDEACSVYACFEQPDLKAPYTVRVTSDARWSVVANGAGTQVEPGRWEFATTSPLATYFVGFAAGPYHRVGSEHDGIPLALYARASLAAELDAQAPEILAITAACFDRYHEMFGVRYAFGKYDQAFVPEFTLGAMENPGCVTLRDDYIFTSAVTDAERENRAMVIAHEMAHMWFGDLVTMEWWDDLWLNESFAEYLGYRVVSEVTEFTDAWTTFSIGRKAWGYAADQRPSTHPVAPERVDDTVEALFNFDGISYAKGASVLRQLVAWLGDDAFLAGMRSHFAAHAFGNATLADLLAALGDASGRDLSEWARVWLRTAQVSTLRPDVTLDADGRYASVDIVQSAPPVPPAAQPVLRPHRINVATGVLADDGRLRPRDVVEVAVDGVRTRVVGLAGKPAGDLLLVNDGDLTYAKIRLDDASMAGLVTTLPATGDSLTRALLWGAVWDATRDAEIAATTFLDVCAAALPVESNVAIFADVVGYALDHAVDRYLPPEDRDEARERLGDSCLEALASSRPGSGWQLAAARAWIRCAGPADVDRLRSWLDGSDEVPDRLLIDADLRWELTCQLAALGGLSEQDIDAEYARDHTATGAERAARARALRPDPDAKAAAWARLIEDETLSNRQLFVTAAGFWRADQTELTRSYVERYATDMPAMATRRVPQVADRIAHLAYPAYAVDPATLTVMSAMASSEDLTPALRRAVVDANDEMARSLAARSLVSRSLASGD